MEDLVTLASDWSSDIDPTGWWVSRKVDGVLALWDGERFITRRGNSIAVQHWFTMGLPQDRLLGELSTVNESFPDTLSIVRRARPRELDWARMKFNVFDAPDVAGPFEGRLFLSCQAVLTGQDIWRGSRHERPRFAPKEFPTVVAMQTRCDGPEHFDALHMKMVSQGAEGTMLRRPGSLYRVGRSRDLLRRKDWLTDEAVVIAHNRGASDFRSLRCRLMSEQSIEFDVGSGLSAAQVTKPISIGTIVTIRYKSRTASGSLREPSFVCVRDYE